MQEAGRGNYAAIGISCNGRKENMFAKIKKLKGIYWIIFLHILIGFLCSFFFFQGLGIEAGWENRAYAYLWSGESLREDKLSRMLCFLASYVLAIVLIWLLWKFLFYFL